MLLSTLFLTWRNLLCYILFVSFIFLLSTFSLYSLQAQTLPSAWVNELHYDNAGTDTGEAIEIVVENAPDYDITLFSITLYNGSDGKTYKTISLSTAIKGDVFFPFSIYTMYIPSIQNGPADGIALSYNGTLLQFLSYEGSFVATDGVAIDLQSTDILVAESSATPIGYSLQLTGTGDQYATFAWTDASQNTFGMPNTGQTLIPIDGPEPVMDLKQEHITPDKIQISWTKPVGLYGEDWDGVLLLASDAGPNAIDFSGKDYTDFQGGGNVFRSGTTTSNGFVVTRKETNENGSVIITGLSPDTTYNFAAYTFLNIDGSGNDEFSTASSEIIAVAQTAEVANIEATPLFEKARLSWNNLMGAPGIWWNEVVVLASEHPLTAILDKKSYTADATFGSGEEVAPGEYIVYSGKDENAVITGLNNLTPYYFKVFVRYDIPDSFVWSKGVETGVIPKENKKYWTGAAGNNLFADANNWSPTGVPENSNDVVLDHQFMMDPYTVDFPIAENEVTLNSLKVIPGNSNAITVKLLAENNSDLPALTLLDEKEPLLIGDYGIFINKASGKETLAVPHGSIKMESQSEYIHQTPSGHGTIINNIAQPEGFIPGTILFNVPASSYITSLQGKSFQNLQFSSETDNTTYSASGSNPLEIQESLSIDKNATLNLSLLEANLTLKGDLTLSGSLLTDYEIITNGTKDQNIKSENPEGIYLKKWRVMKTSGDIVLQTPVTITESLAMVQGNIETSGQKIILDFTVSNPVITGISEISKINGSMEIARMVGVAKTSFDLAGLTFEEGVDDLGMVKVTSNAGLGAIIEAKKGQSIQRNWSIEAEYPLSTSRDLTFNWEETDDTGADLTMVKVYQNSEDSEEWLPLEEEYQNVSLTRSITASTTKLTKFTIADVNNILPVTMQYFTATIVDKKAFLQWATQTETNNMGFEVEKSYDGHGYFKLYEQKGAGNSLVKHSYSYTDLFLLKSAYYRIKQVDTNGDFTYSPIRYLFVAAQENPEVLLYPNPVTDRQPVKLQFNFTPRNEIINNAKIYGVQGIALKQWNNIEPGMLEKELSNYIQNINTGLYILQLSFNEGIQKIKLLIN